VNWPALKASVDAVSAASQIAHDRPGRNPFVGVWTADVAKSRRHPANPFQRATIEFAVDGDVVTMTDVFVDEAGRETRDVNTLHVDGVERVGDYGYAVTAAWRSAHELEVVVKKFEDVVGRATYQVSPDGRVLTTSDLAGEQVIVLGRAGLNLLG
jgi:hypothetical protein